MVMGGYVNCSCPRLFVMARAITSVFMFWFHVSCWWSTELSPQRLWLAFNLSLESPHRDFPCVLCYIDSMPKHKKRLRGKPRRGSPWRPRRPSFFEHDSSSPAQPSLSQPPPPTASSTPLDLISRSPYPSLRLLFAPPGSEQPPIQRSTLPSTLGDEPPPRRRAPGNDSTPSVDATTPEQIKDKLGILYGLVFELRQGVEDLQFRLQLANDWATLFLQLLSSLYEIFHSTPVNAETANGEAMGSEFPPQAQGTATTTGDMVTQGTAAPLPEDPARKDRAAEKKEEVEMQWGDGTTIVEEEPWTGDLNATWPGYAPTV
jgi:hypothetical protein